ncbi:MAG TPA: VCBS repeat-containing protein [Candidatus Acidoferrum sp.]|nr:VCBS repeat-containing protein [Candidatus Acidoferrum sp.]
MKTADDPWQAFQFIVAGGNGSAYDGNVVIKCLVNASRPAVLLVSSGWLVLAWAGLGVRASELNWSAGPGYRSAALSIPKSGQVGFTLLPPEVTGIAFTNGLSDAKAAENQIRLNGSGVACGDVDGDGRCDLYFCGLENGNKLYRNLGGWKFEDITESAGVACADQYSTGAVFADVNGDGHLDLLVNGIGKGTRLFLNDGKGRFHEVSGGGLVHKFAATSLTLADIDGDGYLDLYVPNYRTTTIRLRFGQRWGPAREIHAGSGYWSQDSPVQVMGTPEAPSAAWVRWPGGKTQQVAIPPGAKEMEVRLATNREQ